MKYLKLNKPVLATISILFLGTILKAQGTASQPAMADFMRSNGKIYVVVGVLTLIFIGIVAYLIALNSKLNKLEKLIQDKK